MSAAEKAKLETQLSELLRLQGRLLEHCIHLQTHERKLAGRVAEKRNARSSPLRQVELERQRLARELHTGVGQLLTSIHLQVEMIAAFYADHNPVLQQALARVGELAGEALERVRSVSKSLHPPAWQGLGLESAVQQLWDLSGIAQRFDSRLRLPKLSAQPSLDAKVLLYRAAQEAISNAIRHSRANRVEALLEVRGDRIVLRFEDDGIGFDVAQMFIPGDLAGGLGLRAIQEQAEALGGSLRIESGASSGSAGVMLEVSVPFDAELP